MDKQDDVYNEFLEELNDTAKSTVIASFFKLLVANYKDVLRIPRAFVAGSTFEYGPSIILIGPSKNRWEVVLSKQDGDVLMTKGWCCFAKDHNLEYGYSLLFEQVEARTYQVGIFDLSAVEVNDRFSVFNGSGGACQGIYCLNDAEREFNVKYEMQLAHIKGVRISEWSFNALKEELKSRNMAVWGTKSDVVHRLQLAIVAEKVAAKFSDDSGNVEIKSEDESDSTTIVISDSEDNL